MRRRTGAIACAVALTLAAWPDEARALDKQGSGAHGGMVSGEEQGFDVAGALSMGVSLWNPSYAARPDNSGLTLMRYAGHADIDLIGRKLSIPVDLNMFTDRLASGAARKLVPSEFDTIVGVTTTWSVGPGAVELGTRVEHDRPVDGGGYAHTGMGGDTQTYADARARFLYSADAIWPDLGRALHNGDIAGWLTLGWFAYNPTTTGTYFARPDNSGRAFLRYAVHTELSLWNDYVSFGFDATMFTDSRADVVVRPTELDFTPEIIGHLGAWELHLAYERDMPVDRGGLVQKFLYALVAFEFDLKHTTPPTLETLTHIPSP